MIKMIRMAVAASVVLAGSALACHESCQSNPSVPSSKRECDISCDPVLGTCGGGTFAACDICPSHAPDGKCVICGKDNSATITGTTGDDIVCMGGGNDIVDGKGGDDHISWNGIVTLTATGEVINTAPAGNYQIDGGPGNDTIITGDGDDRLYGGTGNDTLIACGGRNSVNGQDGNDTVASGLVCTPADDAVGSLLCGGKGNDVLFGGGPAHQCMDAGADQSPSGNDCTYTFSVTPSRSATAFDIGTARNCASANITVNQEPCGCETGL